MQKSNCFTKILDSKIKASFIFIILLSTQLFAQIIPNELLNSISNYKIGDDRSKLAEINQIVVDALKVDSKKSSVEDELLNFFKSAVTFDAKQFASRELRLVGSEKSADELKQFLTDEKLSDLARYALEEIQNPAVDHVFIDALPNASIKVKIGLINSLGFRKSQTAVKDIAKYLNENNNELAIAAASALGKIGNDECLSFLEKYFNVKNEQQNKIVYDSYLICVDNLLKQDKLAEANEAYNKIYQEENTTFPIKQAALAGIINSSNNKEKEIISKIKDAPDELKFIPISKIRELKNISDLNKFSNSLIELSPANQIQLLSIFEEIGNPQIKSSVLPLLNSNTELVRIAVIKTLGSIGDKSEVITLTKIAVEKSGAEADAAQNALDLLNNKNVDEEIISNLKTSDDQTKIILIKAIGERGFSPALNSILDLTNSENRLVKNEAFKTLGEIATVYDIVKIIDLLAKQQDNSDKRKAEYTISTIMKKSEPTKENVELLVSSFNNSSSVNDKVSFLRLLGQTNDDNAYNTLVNEISNDNSEIKIAAITGISMWQNSKPRELLLKTAQNSDDEVQSAALKGFTNFIEMDNQLSVVQKVELYKKSLGLAKTSNEKNIALDGIGHLDTFESLDVIKNYINQSDLKETVDNGINRVSWHLFPTNPERVKEYVKYFLNQIKDEKFQSKNNELLNAIDRYVERNK